MKILFIGDIFGRPGREITRRLLPELKAEHRPDLIIANAENLAHGKGVTEGTLSEMREAGIQVFTSGNHVWRNKGYEELLVNSKLNLLRPLNYPEGAPGEGARVIATAFGEQALVVSLQGRVAMPDEVDDPFRAMDRLLENHDSSIPVIVDFHAEMTSEKIALSHYLDGRVAAVLGTHTHVPTADARITKAGTACITDVGMTGPWDQSVIGVDRDIIIKNFLTSRPVQHQVADGLGTFQAVLIELEGAQATRIEQIIRWDIEV